MFDDKPLDDEKIVLEYGINIGDITQKIDEKEEIATKKKIYYLMENHQKDCFNLLKQNWQ